MQLGVLIAAGGIGSRMGGGSKQLMHLRGKPVLARTISIFDPLDVVSDIVIAIEPGDMERCRREVLEPGGFLKVRQLVPGGGCRAESVQNALEALGQRVEVVAVHDGARPLFPAELLKHGLEVLEKEELDGAVFGLPVTDTIKQASEDRLVESTLDRGRLWSAQTPQIFRRPVLERAGRRPAPELARATDDAALVEALGGRVMMIDGSRENIKLTTPEDLILAEAILGSR